jgi:hypothetical protein
MIWKREYCTRRGIRVLRRQPRRVWSAPCWLQLVGPGRPQGAYIVPPFVRNHDHTLHSPISLPYRQARWQYTSARPWLDGSFTPMVASLLLAASELCQNPFPCDLARSRYINLVGSRHCRRSKERRERASSLPAAWNPRTFSANELWEALDSVAKEYRLDMGLHQVFGNVQNVDGDHALQQVTTGQSKNKKRYT